MKKLENLKSRKFLQISKVKQSSLIGGTTTTMSMPTYTTAGSQTDTTIVDDTPKGPYSV